MSNNDENPAHYHEDEMPPPLKDHKGSKLFFRNSIRFAAPLQQTNEIFSYNLEKYREVSFSKNFAYSTQSPWHFFTKKTPEEPQNVTVTFYGSNIKSKNDSYSSYYYKPVEHLGFKYFVNDKEDFCSVFDTSHENYTFNFLPDEFDNEKYIAVKLDSLCLANFLRSFATFSSFFKRQSITLLIDKNNPEKPIFVSEESNPSFGIIFQDDTCKNGNQELAKNIWNHITALTKDGL